jgi:GWxTD domain-containing protein
MFSMTAAFLSALLLSRGQLPEKYSDWLGEEVAYLITEGEKKAFLALGSDEERDRFIAYFWQARDPTAGTERNEFREEYEERRREADLLFRGSGRRGSKTERGRIHAILGEPRERRTFPNSGELWPIELWFYQVDDPNLPPFFYVVFYQRGGAGDFRLWDPVTEGPGALVASESANPLVYDRSRVQAILQGVDTDLYQAVTEPVPGEPSGSSYFGYQKVLAVLEGYPNRSLNSAYADRYRPGKGIVEADYTFRELDLAPLIALTPSANGPFVHFALGIRPENVSFAQYRDTYYTVFDLEGELATAEGTPVHLIQERREIEVAERDWERASRSPVSLQGRFPIIEGDFRLRLMVRSVTGRNFDSFETGIHVPPSLVASDVFPAQSFQPRRSGRGELAFQFRETLAVPRPSASFRPGGKLLAFLVVGPEYGEPTVALRGAIRRGEETHHEIERSFPRDDPSKSALVALEVGLGRLPPGDYRLDIDLGEREERVLPFLVEPGNDPPAPLVNSPEEPESESGYWNFLRARQYLSTGRNREALAALESAVERSPELETARIQLAVIALGLEEPERALKGIEPGLMRSPFHYEFLSLAGFACEQLGRFEDAARYYERARDSSKADDKLSQALARVHEKLGRNR